MRRLRWLPAFFTLLLLQLSCGGPREPRWNVVLITLDTLRADHLGCYGYAHARTPNIDAFAAEALQFERAFSTINTTLPSHAAMLTGQFPRALGVPRNSFPVPEDVPVLAELLAEQGYATAAFVSASALHADLGLARGFATYDQTFDVRGVDQEQRRAEATTRAVLEWWEARPAKPFFLWVHYFDPHYPYTPPPPYDALYGADYNGPADGSMEYLLRIWGWSGPKITAPAADLQRLVDLYDGEIAYLDHWLGPLLARLGQDHVREHTLVIIVADHGESLTEHDYLFNHGRRLYEPSIRVPLMLRFPGAMAVSPRTVRDQVQSRDLFATILSIAGIDPPAGDSSVDLVPLAHGEPYAGGPYAFAEASRPWEIEKMYPKMYPNMPKAQMVVAYPWKLIVTPFERTVELYNLDEDPGELTNLAPQHGDRVANLREQLDQWWGAKLRMGVEPDPRSLERLRSLGYIK
jgi:arylsulfatase A-like enzyme